MRIEAKFKTQTMSTEESKVRCEDAIPCYYPSISFGISDFLLFYATPPTFYVLNSKYPNYVLFFCLLKNVPTMFRTRISIFLLILVIHYLYVFSSLLFFSLVSEVHLMRLFRLKKKSFCVKII